MQQTEIIIIIGTILLGLVISVIAILLVSKTRTQLMRSISLINDLHKHIKSRDSAFEQLESVVDDINQMMSSQEVTIEQVKDDLKQHLQEINKLSANDPVLKTYSKAAQMVDAGENIDDIMIACGLPRAEVEVLSSMRKK